MGAVESLRNVGPVTARLLAEVGIRTEEELREVGAPLAYRLLHHRSGAQISLLYLYALAGALDGRDLNGYSVQEKVRLRNAASGDLRIG